MNTDTNSTQQNSKYNYDKWTLKVNEINSDFSKSLNLIIRNKPHTKVSYCFLNFCFILM